MFSLTILGHLSTISFIGLLSKSICLISCKWPKEAKAFSFMSKEGGSVSTKLLENALRFAPLIPPRSVSASAGSSPGASLEVEEDRRPAHKARLLCFSADREEPKMF